MKARLAGVAVLAAFIVVAVGCEATDDGAPQGPSIEIDVDGPKTKTTKPKPAHKGPSNKAPSTTRKRR